MMALVAHDSTPGFERTFAVDWISFFEQNTSVLRDGQWVQFDVPADVNLSSHREWLLFRPQKDWTVNGTVYPAGSLLTAGFEDFLAGSRELSVLFTPDAHTSLQSWSWTQGLPPAEPAPRRLLRNPGPGSAAPRHRLRLGGHRTGRLPAAA